MNVTQTFGVGEKAPVLTVSFALIPTKPKMELLNVLNIFYFLLLQIFLN